MHARSNVRMRSVVNYNRWFCIDTAINRQSEITEEHIHLLAIYFTDFVIASDSLNNLKSRNPVLEKN